MLLREAIFKVSNLKKEKDTLLAELQNYNVFPISVNEKEIENIKENQVVDKILSDLDRVTKEIEDLQKLINKANYESGLKDLIDLVKSKRSDISWLNRRYLMTLTNYNKNKFSVENGAVIKYAPLREKVIREKVDLLTKEVEELSLEIDRLNNSWEVPDFCI